MISGSLASSAGGSAPNEDWVGLTPSALVVLDGLSAPAGVGGCSHGTPWYVTNLGGALLTALASAVPIREALAEALTVVARAHESTCDLSDPGTPSATVTAIRRTETRVDALVLADSSIVIETRNSLDVLTDARVEAVLSTERDRVLTTPPDSPSRGTHLAHLVTAQRELRNVPDGYWVAQGSPDAAQQAYVQSWPQEEVVSATALTDGVSRLVDVFDVMTWRDLVSHARTHGANSVVSEVRALEAQDPSMVLWPRYKASDDATIAHWRML